MLENDIKKYLREVEKVLDNHHKSFPIFSNKRELVLLQVLRIFEDLTRLRGFFDRKPILLGQREIEIHNLLDSLAMAIQWIFEECDVCTKPPSLEMDNDLYVEALSLLMSAGDYRTVCDGYTMWSRGRHISEINEKEKRIKFVPRSDMNLAYEAADTVLETRRKIEPIKSIKFNKCFLSIMAVSDQLVKTVKQINGYIVYEIPGDVWGAFKDFSQLMIEESFELPPDWDFGVFSLREFSSFWQALHAKCMIHAWACLKSGVVGAGIESVVMIKTPDELASEISHLGQITPEKSRAITDYLTFDLSIKNNDVIFQPFIPFFGGKLAISPSLIITSRAERNLACLINKKDQQVYSRLSSTKEKLILSDLQTLLKGMYPSLGIEIKCQLPDSRPDIDLILYDRENAALAMVEVKWLIPSDSIKEVFSRDEDIQKGLSQAKIVSDYYASNPVDVQKRAFGEEIPVKCAFTFVLTKNNIGSSNLKRVVPVIDQTSFLKLISISKGNLCVLKCLFDEEAFLPKEGIDWALMTVETKYAGYTLTGPGFLMDPQPSDLLKKKVSRNDPCPCGKINEVTKKPMKYKKCCGK